MDLSRRKTLAGMGAAFAAMLPWQVCAAGEDRMSGDLAFVNPELRTAVATMRDIFGGKPCLTVESIEALRKQAPGDLDPPLPGVPVSKHIVPGSAQNPPVAVYVVNARSGRARGGIVYMHGGGYVLGSAAQDIGTCQKLAAALDCTVVSVDYRLAPEARYAASIEDNYAALRWAYANARDIGIDPRRIAVMGESAGGGHAALLAIAARDRGEIPLCLQCLVYPMLDDRTGTTHTVPAHIGTLGWTAKTNRFGWQAFLGREPGDPGIADGVPGRDESLANLPPAWIGVGALDLFVQEDIAFAERLITAAVPTELVVVPGAFHAFQHLAPDSRVAKTFTSSMLTSLKMALG